MPATGPASAATEVAAAVPLVVGIGERGSARTTMAEPTGKSAQRLSSVAGAVVAVVSLLVLAGWGLELEPLKAVLPGLATMKANTALCFLLAGVALVIRERRVMRLACAGLVCAVAGLTLAEYITGGNFGFDQFLFRDMQDQPTIYPGRMAEATALGFLLSSVSLLLLKARARAALQAQQSLAAGAAIIGAMAVLGYFYDVQQLYRFAGYSSMALHTAALFVVLAAGLILARPDGLAAVLMTPGPGAQLTRLLLPSTILAPAVMGWVIQFGLRQGFYGEGMDIALLVLLTIVTLTTMVLWSTLALNRSDAARKRTEEQLKASLAEKEVMLREIHHRVKNNLQVISSLVNLQADGSTDETVREVLRDVIYRVRSMALVHEKLYQSESLSLIDFAEYVRGLFGYLWRAHGAAAATVRLTLDLEPVSLPMDIALPCGLILNELAGNALKHAFRGRAEGEVAVSLKGDAAGLVSISVRDNGVGLPEGLDWRQANSLGLRLMQMLAGQLNATVEMRSLGGTEFRITLTLPQMAKDGEPEHE